MLPDDLRLNIAIMDDKHDESMTILTEVKSSKDGAFLAHFEELIVHTREHFAFEEAMMKTHDFYGSQEHIDEHRDLLGEMEYFYEKSKKSPVFGRAYIDDYAYDKFRRHIINIDSQLAMFLKEYYVT